MSTAASEGPSRGTLRRLLELAGAVAVAAFIFWATVTWLAAVILAFALTSVWILIVVMLLRGRPHQNAALAALAFVVSAAVVELALRSSALTDATSHLPTRSTWDVGRYEVVTPPVLVRDPVLGLRMAGPARARATVTRDGAPVYDVHYTIDGAGYRVTPGVANGGRPVLVMGDSYHFGEGLEDDQTVAAHLARQSGGALSPLNLAVSGYGPHQVLRQLQLGMPQRYGTGRFDYLLLSVIDDHVKRASGETFWQWDSPRYEVVDGRPVLAGTFRPSEFVGNLLYHSIEAALLAQALRRDDPVARFTAIMSEIRREAKARYGADVLALYHVSREFSTGVPFNDGRAMHRLLCQAGVPFIDVSARVPITLDSNARYHIPGDGHPTAALNARVAALAAGFIDGTVGAESCDGQVAERR